MYYHRVGFAIEYDLERILEDNAIKEYRFSKSWSFRVMDVDKFAMLAGMGFAIIVGLFVFWGPSPKPKRRKGKVIGIDNLGYTCFLNSLLQALAACHIFTLWLEEQRKKKDRNFSETLVSVLNQINGFDVDFYGNVTPSEIISSLGTLWNFGPGQQDAHELFHVILSALEVEIQPVNRKGCLSDALDRNISCNDITLIQKDSKPGMIVARSPELQSQNGEYTSIRSFQSLFTTLVSNTSSISMETHPFSGLITNQLQCSYCKWKVPNFKSSVRYDKFETLSLPLPPLKSRFEQQYTLEELLLRFVDNEIVQDVQCDQCSSRCAAIKALSLGKLPKCLCLHISRTTWSSLLTKRSDQVTFPQILVLDPYIYTETKRRSAQGDARYLDANVITQGKHKYQLCAVIEHRGPVDSGHFVCFRRGNKVGQWLYTSDVVVENVSLTQVLLANPYMLFYERVRSS